MLVSTAAKLTSSEEHFPKRPGCFSMVRTNRWCCVDALFVVDILGSCHCCWCCYVFILCWCYYYYCFVLYPDVLVAVSIVINTAVVLEVITIIIVYNVVAVLLLLLNYISLLLSNELQKLIASKNDSIKTEQFEVDQDYTSCGDTMCCWQNEYLLLNPPPPPTQNEQIQAKPRI